MKRLALLLLCLLLLFPAAIAENSASIDIDSLSVEESFALIQDLYRHVMYMTASPDSEYVVFYHPCTVQARQRFWFKPGTYTLLAADDDALVYIGSQVYTNRDSGQSVDPYSPDYQQIRVRIGEPVTVEITEGQYIEVVDTGLLLRMVQ